MRNIMIDIGKTVIVSGSVTMKNFAATQPVNTTSCSMLRLPIICATRAIVNELPTWRRFLYRFKCALRRFRLSFRFRRLHTCLLSLFLRYP